MDKKSLSRLFLQLCAVFFVLTSITNNFSNLLVNASDISSIKRLHESLFAKYNKLITPRLPNGAPIIVRFGLRLQQLIDVDEVHQVVTLRTWVYQEWIDGKLRWDLNHYPNITHIQVPSAYVWRPDLVLHNNAEGRYSMEHIKSLAVVYHDGRVVWEPQAIFKFYCNIAIDEFPFDVQNCTLKFGPWSHSGLQIDLRHNFYAEDPVGERSQVIHRLQDSVRNFGSKYVAARDNLRNAIRLGSKDETFGGRTRPTFTNTSSTLAALPAPHATQAPQASPPSNETYNDIGKSRLSKLLVRWKRSRAAAPMGGGGGSGEAFRESYFDPGIDLRDYTPSTQWDLIGVPAYRALRFYPCCPNEPYPELFFRIVIRRNAVTYLMYFIFPCVGMATLSLFVFYLPADSRQKVHFGVNVFLSLSLFNMAIIEIMPPTSGALPLMGKVLIFTTMCIGLSVLSSIIVSNVQFTNNLTRQRLKPSLRNVFMRQVPRFLGARKPDIARLKNLRRMASFRGQLSYNNNNEHVAQELASPPSATQSVCGCQPHRLSTETIMERLTRQTPLSQADDITYRLMSDYPELSLPLSALPRLREERQQAKEAKDAQKAQKFSTFSRPPPKKALRRWTREPTSNDNVAFSPPTPKNFPSTSPAATTVDGVVRSRKYVAFPRTLGNQRCVARMAKQMFDLKQTYVARLYQQSIGFDWKFATVMVDRVCQIVLSVMFLSGLTYMFLSSPHLYDNRPSLPLKCTWELQTNSLTYYSCTKETSYWPLIVLPSPSPSSSSSSLELATATKVTAMLG